jgi:ABC-type nitrate/sulfonate/bicarbonate transport system substrate-binding protein
MRIAFLFAKIPALYPRSVYRLSINVYYAKGKVMKAQIKSSPISRNSTVLLLLLLLLTGIMVFASACSSGSGSSKDTGGAGDDTKPVPVKMILDWTPNTNHTGIYVAKALGYYDEAGLDVEIIQPADGTAEQLVAAGQGDFGISVQENVTFARTQDDPLPIRSIAAIIQHNTSGFVSLKEEGITSPKDWAGKTYGGYGLPSEENVLKFIAEKNGISYDDITYVNLGEDDILSAFRGDIDFAWVFEAAELINLDKQKAEYNYIPEKDIDPVLDYYTPVIITNDELIEKDPDKVRAFTAATAKGYEYAIANPEESAKILLDEVPELDEYVVTEGQKYLSARYALDAPQWGYQNEEVWSRYADLLFETGQLTAGLDVKAAFTNEFLPEA